MGEIQEAMTKVYLTGSDPVTLMRDRGNVSYDETTDQITIVLNMETDIED
jgi:hypothetical protein